MSTKYLLPRRFVQTFVLVEQPNGYYVLNDFFRCIIDNEEEVMGEEMARTEAVSVPSQQPDAIIPDIAMNSKPRHEQNTEVLRKGFKEEAARLESQPETGPCTDDNVHSTESHSPSPSVFDTLSTVSVSISDKSSPTASELSSISIEEMWDPATMRLIPISCNALISRFMRALLRNVTSNPQSQEGKGSRTTKDRPKHQRDPQGTRNSRKRKLGDLGRGLDDREEDGGVPKHQRTDLHSSSDTYDRSLACPFNKYDNRLFGPDSPDEAYHACATCSFVSVAHLK